MKRFKVTKPGDYWECYVQIDENLVLPQLSEEGKPFTAKDGMREMVLFWSGGESRLENNDGDITKTFLQQLAREIYIILTEHDWTVAGVIYQFKDREGWFLMDGAYGIKIVSVDDLEIYHDDFEVEEITVQEAEK